MTAATTTAEGRGAGALAGLARSVGLVLLVWGALLLAEGVASIAAFRDEIVASWEIRAALGYAAPVGLAVLLPAALGLVLLARATATRRGLQLAGAVLGAACATPILALSSRALSASVVRYGLAGAVALVGAVATWLLAPRLRVLRPATHAALGVAFAAALGVVNATIYVRLYAPLHAALLVLTLASAASVARWLLTVRGARALGALGLVVGVLSAATVGRCAARLAPFDNVRLFLLEHAPALGVAVRVASALAPPPPLADEEERRAVVAPARALDWTGRDVILLSVDALRADHVGAYGYGRGTTPNIDALAKDGAVFEHAYCPTPHTSYSVTSMMTGKYMRPLLKLDVGDDSETLAQILRRYGYKTAAFYPPAVFFIDEQRFAAFRDRGLDFEYRKVEFAEPALRAQQVGAYLAKAREGAPLLLWVHIFEPHEPYVLHPEHPYGPPGRPTDEDRYDSEIATADALIGNIVELVRAKRRDPVFIVTADHGEELGDHGGHHHGTTVFEEQIRVPLIVSGRGVHSGRVAPPVQTIDIVPTALSALGIPVPPRVRGRDLGPELAGSAKADRAGFAFAETDDFAMVADADLRLVCERRVSLCTLYDVGRDPGEKADLSRERPADVLRLRRLLRATELSHGRFEGARKELPDALRRGLQGDREAALDVAALMDDVRPDIRVLAAEVSFRLHTKEAIPSLERALVHADEEDVRRWAALALVRAGAQPPKEADLVLHGKDARFRGLAALSFAERGDARGEAELVQLFLAQRGDFEAEKECLAALATIRAKSAVPALLSALADVRLRPFVADALGAIGARDARAPLLAALGVERYPGARLAEARALVKLDGGAELYAALERFAGVPEPFAPALELAGTARLLGPERGALWSDAGAAALEGEVRARPGGTLRLLVLTGPGDAAPSATVDGAAVPLTRREGSLFTGEVTRKGTSPTARLTARVEVDGAAAGLRGAWLVPLSEDVPLPPPEAWDAGAQPDPEP